MLKKNKGKLLISSFIILLPIVVGLILWNKFPEEIAVHLSLDGTADNWAGKNFVIFGFPLILLVIHWICLFFTGFDPQNKHQTAKAQNMVFWIIPGVSLFSTALIYLTAFGMELNILLSFTIIFIGLLMAIIGNYLPKCRQNYTLGIKIKWTLENEENWNVTHRFGGKVWFIGGLLIIITSLLPYTVAPFVGMGILIVLVLLPVIYSYAYHRKQLKAGTAIVNVPMSGNYKKMKIISICIVTLILAGCAYIMFSGEVNIEYGQKSFTVHSTYWSDVSIDYATIKNVDYKTRTTSDFKVSGFNSAKLLLGTFRNEEYGTYQRYSYRKCLSEVVLTMTDGRTIVLSGVDEKTTEAIGKALQDKTT